MCSLGLARATVTRAGWGAASASGVRATVASGRATAGTGDRSTGSRALSAPSRCRPVLPHGVCLRATVTLARHLQRGHVIVSMAILSMAIVSMAIVSMAATCSAASSALAKRPRKTLLPPRDTCARKRSPSWCTLEKPVTLLSELRSLRPSACACVNTARAT
eukprot:scaffold15784_cov60-Phaeocystis_antarctica.AAC.2